jgi:TonB-dependent receptor
LAFAQDSDPMLEEVVVTGIRASLDRAMDVKRDSSGVVDAISAEDIGKFPDTNLAESLQRITGVSIDRQNGEGSQVTVRGFGPDYNMVTLNGRSMPTAAASPTGISTSRAFDFAQVASEVVSGVEVYKTGKASVASGGIGATINVKTARPLDNPGLNISVGAKAVTDTSNRNGSDVTPEVSGLFSWTDDSEMFGVGLSVSHQQRDSGASGSYVTQWNTQAWTDNTFSAADITNEPDVGQLYSQPTDIRYTIADRERTRDNAQLVLQFRPMDSLTGTLDYTYAQNDLEETRSEQSIWFLNGFDALTYDDSPVASPIVLSQDVLPINGGNSKDLGLAQQARGTSSTLESTGLNLSWDVTDNFSLTLDAHDSSAETTPDTSFGGSWVNFGMGANIVAHQIGYFNDGLPRFVISEMMSHAMI